MTICCLPVNAQAFYSEIPEDIDSRKYAVIIAKYYERETATELFASSAEHASAIPLRTKILDYCKDNQLEINGTLAEQKWQDYLKTNYKNNNEFKLRVQNAYFTEDFVKDKFKKNLCVNDYFNKIIIPKIDLDLASRKRILQLAREKGIGFTKAEIKEKYYQAVENFGGDAAFETFLRNNNLTVKEFLFFIESDLVKDKFTKLRVEEMIIQDQDLKKILTMQDPNEFFFREKIASPSFYFRIAYIDKNRSDAAIKIRDAHRYFYHLNEIKPADVIHRDIEIIDMFETFSEVSNIYSDKISGQLMSMIYSDYSIKDKLSPVLASDQGYFIINLYKIEKPERSLTYQKLLDKRKKELETEIKGNYQRIFL